MHISYHHCFISHEATERSKTTKWMEEGHLKCRWKHSCPYDHYDLIEIAHSICLCYLFSVTKSRGTTKYWQVLSMRSKNPSWTFINPSFHQASYRFCQGGCGHLGLSIAFVFLRPGAVTCGWWYPDTNRLWWLKFSTWKANPRQTTLMIHVDKLISATWSSKETWSWTATPSFTPHHPRTSAWDRSNPAWLSWGRLFSTAGTGAKPVALTNLQPAIQTCGHRGEKTRMKALTYINQYKAENVKQCNGENPFVGPSVHISTEETTSVGQMEFSAQDTWTNTLSL